MTNENLKYDWVIIGGGVIGCTIARELSLNNIKNIAVIELNRLGSGATKHSGGFVRVIHHEPHISKMAFNSILFLKYKK